MAQWEQDDINLLIQIKHSNPGKTWRELERPFNDRSRSFRTHDALRARWDRYRRDATHHDVQQQLDQPADDGFFDEDPPLQGMDPITYAPDSEPSTAQTSAGTYGNLPSDLSSSNPEAPVIAASDTDESVHLTQLATNNIPPASGFYQPPDEVQYAGGRQNYGNHGSTTIVCVPGSNHPQTCKSWYYQRSYQSSRSTNWSLPDYTSPTMDRED